jgi:tetratricopeptide (TPR) repeat protein
MKKHQRAKHKATQSSAATAATGLHDREAGRRGKGDRAAPTFAADPRQHADFLRGRALAHAADNELDQAIKLIAEAIALNPNEPNYFFDLGRLLQRQNRLEEALKSFDLAIRLKADFVDVWINMGDVLQRQSRFDEALLTFDHALRLDPTSAKAAKKSAALLMDLKRFEEALARLDVLNAIAPNQADVLFSAGSCLSSLRRTEAAAESFSKSLEINPDQFQAHLELAFRLSELGKPNEALSQMRRALDLRPGAVEVMNNIGIVLNALGRFEEAIAIFDRAIAISPGFAEPINNKGFSLQKLERYDEAIAAHERAIALSPERPLFHYNRGVCFSETLGLDEAISSFRKAIALEPDYAQAHYNLATNSLLSGDLRTGFIENEWRFKCPELRLPDRGFDRPVWLGEEKIAGKVLLIHLDQGFGDAIQCARYIPLVAALGATVILETYAPLQSLLSRVPGVSRVVPIGQPLPDFDFHCSTMSLPAAFGTTLQSIPSSVPYLSTEQTTMTTWRARLGTSGAPRVGLVWSGHPGHVNDQRRSVELQMLLPLLEVEAQFISLQKEPRPYDQATLRERDDILDLGSELASYEDTAALIEQLDLVISVDTSVAHLAGALGKPVWIMLPYVPDWRWLVGRDDSPWYPTARLFRQTDEREYTSVVNRMKTELHALTAALAARGER